MPLDEGPSLGELSRRLTDVFSRFESLARRLEDGQYVRTDLYLQFKMAVDTALSDIQARLAVMDKEKLARDDMESLDTRISQLEDDKKWLIRLVLAFIILGVLGAIFLTTGGGGGGS
jgi:hypothetical protein